MNIICCNIFIKGGEYSLKKKATKSKKKDTKSFVLTFKLSTTVYEEHIITKRFIIEGQIYNACLNKLYRGYNAMIRTKEYNSLNLLIKDHLKQFSKIKDNKTKLKQWVLKQRELNKMMYALRDKYFLNNTPSMIMLNLYNTILKLT